MAAKTLKDMKNEFDGDALDDIAKTSSDKREQSRGKGPGAGLPAKIKGMARKVFSSKKAVMITVAGMVLFIGLITGGLLFLGKSPEKGRNDQEKTAAKEDVKAAALVKAEVIFEDIIVLKPFERIHLKEGSGLKSISMNLSLELSDSRYKKEVHAMEDKIREIITEQVGGMTGLDLRNPEGKIMFKYDLIKQMNSIFPGVMVRNIYFTYFLMQ